MVNTVDDPEASDLEERAGGGDENDEQEEVPLDFNLFILSLNASALMHLGEPAGRVDATEVNLPMARQTIDMIALLEQKTRGNLSGEEERLLNQVLFDLRMRFANKAGGGSRPPTA